jgi:hypothetical protein
MEPALVRFEHAPPPVSPWAEAGHDASAFGAALDRVFGDASEVHLLEHFTASDPAILIADDPLVLLANLADSLGLPIGDPVPAPMPEFAAVYDFTAGADGFNPHDLWIYDAHA